LRKLYSWPETGTGEGLNRPSGGTKDVNRTGGENLAGGLIPPRQLAPGRVAMHHSCSARAKRTIFLAKSARTLLCERILRLSRL